MKKIALTLAAFLCATSIHAAKNDSFQIAVCNNTNESLIVTSNRISNGQVLPLVHAINPKSTQNYVITVVTNKPIFGEIKFHSASTPDKFGIIKYAKYKPNSAFETYVLSPVNQDYTIKASHLGSHVRYEID